MAAPAASIDTPHGRHYITPDGEAVPSITNIIGAGSDQSFLIPWAAKTAAQYAVDNATALAKSENDAVGLITSGSAVVRDQAAALGTKVHEAIESLTLGGPEPTDKEVVPFVRQWKQWRDEYQPEVIAVEQTFFGDGFAGTADLVCKIGGEVWIVDWKGLALTTPIPTPNGWSTMGALQQGDTVFDAYGNQCKVTAKSQVKEIGTYIVTFNDRSQIVCDSEHIWWATNASDRAKASRLSVEATPRPVTIDEIRKSIRHGSVRPQLNWVVPVCGSLSLPDADLPIEPYLLGVWLGDGRARGGEITKPDDDLFDNLRARGHVCSVDYNRRARREENRRCQTRSIVGLSTLLREHGLKDNKHIPDVYLRASHAQRMELLRGLMDTDGSWNRPRRRAVFSTCDKALAGQFMELTRSLGYKPHLAENIRAGFGLTVTAFDIEFTASVANPFNLPRKRDLVTAATPIQEVHATRRLIASVERGPDVPTACIAVDSETNTYLAGEDFIPTHNTGSVSKSAYAQLNALAMAAEREGIHVDGLAAVQIRPRSFTHIEVPIDLRAYDVFMGMRRAFEWNVEMADWGKRR